MFNVARRGNKSLGELQEIWNEIPRWLHDRCVPWVGVWGVGEFPGFQGASKASPPDPPICYPSPRPDIRPHSLNCLTFFVESRAGRGGGWYLDLLGKKYDNVARARNILLGWEEI